MSVKRDYTVTPRVQEYLKARIGEVVTAYEIANALDIPNTGVSKALSTLARRGLVEYVQPRGNYIYRGAVKKIPITPTPDQIFQFVGTMQDGGLVAKDVDTDILYVFTKL